MAPFPVPLPGGSSALALLAAGHERQAVVQDAWQALPASSIQGMISHCGGLHLGGEAQAGPVLPVAMSPWGWQHCQPPTPTEESPVQERQGLPMPWLAQPAWSRLQCLLQHTQ